MLSKKLILSSLTTLLFLNSHLLAEDLIEEVEEVSIDGHVSIRTREMDPEKREMMQQLRAKEVESEDSSDQADRARTFRRVSNQLLSSQNDFMLAPLQITSPQPTLAAYAYPTNCHWLTSISDNNRSFELEDGSHWEISPSDSYVLRSWRREDSLVITPNYSWLSPYDYYITNKNNNSYVRANLYVGPLAFGPYSHWIVNIDYFGGHIYLENQMIWCISPQDSYLLKDWAVNDHVIFGLHDSWFSPFDHILINVNMDNHLRVKQY